MLIAPAPAVEDVQVYAHIASFFRRAPPEQRGSARRGRLSPRPWRFASDGRTAKKNNVASKAARNGVRVYSAQNFTSEYPCRVAAATRQPMDTAGLREHPLTDPIATAAATTVKPTAKPAYCVGTSIVATFSTT